MDRSVVVAAVRAHLASDLAGVLANAEAAISEATHTESKAENKYDTRGLEASYLAAGASRRIAGLRQQLAFFEVMKDPTGARIQVGSLVCLEDEQGARWCFVVPGSGGGTVDVDGAGVALVSATSPLGRAMVGSEEGDAVAWETPRGPRELEVVEVA